MRVEHLRIQPVVVDGLMAPWRYLRGLVVSSLAWVGISLLLSYEMSRHRTWQETGRGIEWRYNFDWYSGTLFTVQFIALASFFISWSRGLYFGRSGDNEFRLIRFDRRMWWMFRETIKLILGMTVIGAGFGIGFFVASMVTSFLGLGVPFIILASLVITVGICWFCCRFSLLWTGIAIDDDPRDVVDAWDYTDGWAWRIFGALAPQAGLVLLLYGLIAVSVTRFAFGSGESVGAPFTPIWSGLTPDMEVPLWFIACDVLFDWVSYAWLFATLAYLYRRLSPPPLDEDVAGVF